MTNQQTHNENNNIEHKFKPMAYDSLACCKRMIKKGVAKKTAEAIAGEMTQGQNEYFNNFATKKCVEESENRLNNKIDSEIKDVKNEIKVIKQDIKNLENSTKKDLQLAKQDIIFKPSSLMVICFGISTAYYGLFN